MDRDAGYWLWGNENLVYKCIISNLASIKTCRQNSWIFIQQGQPGSCQMPRTVPRRPTPPHDHTSLLLPFTQSPPVTPPTTPFPARKVHPGGDSWLHLFEVSESMLSRNKLPEALLVQLWPEMPPPRSVGTWESFSVHCSVWGCSLSIQTASPLWEWPSRHDQRKPLCGWIDILHAPTSSGWQAPFFISIFQDEPSDAPQMDATAIPKHASPLVHNGVQAQVPVKSENTVRLTVHHKFLETISKQSSVVLLMPNSKSTFSE